MTLGYVSLFFYINRLYDDNVIHNYEEDGDSFHSIRTYINTQYPGHRIVSMSYDTGNDPVQDVTYTEDSLSEFASRLNGPSGQRYGDGRIDIHLSTIGINEE